MKNAFLNVVAFLLAFTAITSFSALLVFIVGPMFEAELSWKSIFLSALTFIISGTLTWKNRRARASFGALFQSGLFP